MVLALAMVVYLVALAALRRLQRPAGGRPAGGRGDADGAGAGGDRRARRTEVAVGAGPAAACGPAGATSPQTLGLRSDVTAR